MEKNSQAAHHEEQSDEGAHMYKKIQLDNGVRIILNKMKYMESASIGVWLATGSRYEKRNTSGISHYLEHMVFKGTPTRNARAIKEEIEGRGGSLNAFTSEEITCYLAKVSRYHIGTALDVLSDMVLNAKLARKDIEKERTVIIEEIKMYKDLPNQYVYDVLNELMWPSHPLGWSITGDIESVKSIKRQDLLNYKTQTYSPSKTAVVICGNFDEDQIMRRIKKIFKTKVKENNIPLNEYKDIQAEPQIKILPKDLEQSHLLIGLRSFGKMHRDRYVLSLLHVILGANMSSRLFESLREKKGLAYEIGTEIKRYKETGAFMVKAGIDHNKVCEAVKVIIKELHKIRTIDIPNQELKRAKEFFKVQFLLSLEDTLEHMLHLGNHVISTGKIPEKKEIIKKIDSISGTDLKRVAKDIFNSKNINLALIGPMDDKDRKELEKELRFI